MAANLNIFIRPVEMYLMMASVWSTVSSPTAPDGMNVKRKPVRGCQVGDGGSSQLQTPWFVPPGLQDGD